MGKKKSNGYGRGTFIDTKMILSPAFINLGNRGSSPATSSFSHALLLMLLGKRQFGQSKDRKGNTVKLRADDNRFDLTYKELESHGIKRPAIPRAIDELLAKGFIDIVDRGGAYEKHKTIYALTDDWQFWKLGDAPVRTRTREPKRGYQGASVIPFPQKQQQRA